MCSGETTRVMGEMEARWWNSTRDTYLKQTSFTEVTDLQDMDRMLLMELMIFRWTQWLTAGGKDYLDDYVDEDQLRKNIKEASGSLNILKEAMGLTKRSRDDAANAGDFSRWFTDLKRRAKAFGIHRENQLQRALVLMNELSSVVGSYDRSDTEEREKLGFPDEKSIVEWIRSTMLPEFREVDEHFREHEQRMWNED